MSILMEGQLPRAGARHISTHAVLAGLVLGAILVSRLATLNYNTAFVDEAIYLSVGQRVLKGDFHDNALQWMTGSYLYPVAVALAAQTTEPGLLGARMFSALVTSLAALGVYLASRRLFSSEAALLGTLVFGFTGVSLFTGTLATYDSLGIGMLGLSTAMLALGLTDARSRRQILLCLLAAALFVLSVLSKYIALAWLLPVAVLGLLLLATRQWRRFTVLTGAFVLPVVVLLIGYGVLIWNDLQLFLAQFSALTGQPAPRGEVLQKISYAVRVPFVLAVLGTITAVRAATPGQRLILVVLWVAALVMPMHHLISANARSVDKSMTYALLFAAPLAGLGLLALLRIGMRASGRQSLTLTLTTLFLLVGLQVWNDQAWVLQRTWPNADATLDFLRRQPVTPQTQVLAEGGNLYDYYLDWGEQAQVTTTWANYFSYDQQQGPIAFERAIDDGYFDYLIFDRYFTPALSNQLAQHAQANGYTLIFSDPQTVLGDEERIFTFEVYARSATGAVNK